MLLGVHRLLLGGLDRGGSLGGLLGGVQVFLLLGELLLQVGVLDPLLLLDVFHLLGRLAAQPVAGAELVQPWIEAAGVLGHGSLLVEIGHDLLGLDVAFLRGGVQQSDLTRVDGFAVLQLEHEGLYDCIDVGIVLGGLFLSKNLGCIGAERVRRAEHAIESTGLDEAIPSEHAYFSL